MRQSLTGLIESTVSTLWPLATEIWDAWGIQLLVVFSFTCQIILVHLGRRRRHSVKVLIRIIVWASYLLASNIGTIALGKLTVITIRNPENPEYNVELQALLAPLLLMHLANPDSISAYAVEDTRMGRRRALILLVQACVVIWILVRCFDSSSSISMFLYIPLFIAGIIKPLATIVALASVYDDTTSAEELNKMEPRIFTAGKKPEDAPDCLDHVLMAYHRFDCLRPHRANWIYHSAFVKDNWMSLDRLEDKHAFHVIEMELGFVYDVIYTQLPIMCTKRGLAGRAISIICLVSALIGFSIIYRSAFLIDSYVAYTYAILIGSIIMELYQVFTLPFSYTAVIALWEWVKNKTTILAIIVSVCSGQKLWSDSLAQFNLVDDCCLKRFFPKPRSVSCIRRKPAHLHLKEAILKKVREFDRKIKGQEEDKKIKIAPFEIRGLWIAEHIENVDMEIVKSFMNRELDKCIIIWHIVTDILNPLDIDDSKDDPHSVSKLLSNYMMYLLKCHPYMLFLSTGDITLGYASSKLRAALPSQLRSSLRQQLQKAILQNQVKGSDDKKYETFTTRVWDVLGDAKKLATELEKLNDGDKWKLVSSAWIEMLCYAARKSQVYQHMTMLRRGGELITHVWLLLLHNIDKFPYQQEDPTSDHSTDV